MFAKSETIYFCTFNSTTAVKPSDLEHRKIIETYYAVSDAHCLVVTINDATPSGTSYSITSGPLSGISKDLSHRITIEKSRFERNYFIALDAIMNWNI